MTTTVLGLLLLQATSASSLVKPTPVKSLKRLKATKATETIFSTCLSASIPYCFGLSSAASSLWHEGNQMIQTVANACENTIVVIHSTGQINMEAWVEHPNVKAIIWASLPGEHKCSWPYE